MKRNVFLSMGVVVFITGAFLFSQDDESDLDRVIRQVEFLRKEVSSLAAQIDLLKAELATLRSEEANKFLPGIPPGTPEGEINGLKYYLLPVSEEPTKTP